MDFASSPTASERSGRATDAMYDSDPRPFIKGSLAHSCNRSPSRRSSASASNGMGTGRGLASPMWNLSSRSLQCPGFGSTRWESTRDRGVRWGRPPAGRWHETGHQTSCEAPWAPCTCTRHPKTPSADTFWRRLQNATRGVVVCGVVGKRLHRG